jgi:hypothetical protein
MTYIPDVNDADVLEAAQHYAGAGLYVGPLRKGTKNPGLILGGGWQHKTSRDPDQLHAWFADTDHDLFIHCGRSGLLVIDVDYPDKVPPVLGAHLGSAPYQSTRPDQPGRGHYIFAQPHGRTIGNGQGKLGSAWGDVRGLNGVIVAAPSDNGRYRWIRTGDVPVLPGDVSDQLGNAVRRAKDEPTVATDAQVTLFVESYGRASWPGALDGRVKGLQSYLDAGNGRHTGALPFITGAMEESSAGLYAARDVVDRMWPPFRDAAMADGSRSESSARYEFGGLLAWAVARALEADPDEIRKRAEKAMPNTGKLFDNITANAKREQTADSEPPKAKAAAGPRVWRSDELSESAPLDWLGVKHIPEAAVTLLTGDEGIGKSLLWVLVAAAITTGSALPEFGIPEREPRHVLVIVTEDDWASVVRPRLELAGADMDYVSVVCSEPDGSGSPLFPRDIDLVISTVPSPYLIVVDAWADTVEGHLSVKDGQHARQALHPWKEVATKLRAAVVLLTHTNRATGTSIRERYALTSELRKKARMALFAQQDESGNLVVGPDKSNLVGKVPAAIFTVEVEQVFEPTESSDGKVPRLVFVKTADYTAAELLAESAGGGEKNADSARGMAKIAIGAILQDGEPHDAAAVIEELGRAGIARATAYRALDEMEIVHGRAGFPASATWQLSRSVSRPDLSSETETTETTETTAEEQTSVVSTDSPVVSVVSPYTDGSAVETNAAVEEICRVCGLPGADPHSWCES